MHPEYIFKNPYSLLKQTLLNENGQNMKNTLQNNILAWKGDK